MIQEMMGKLNQEQYDAVTKTLTKDTLLLAGPGSGKTRVLQTRFLYLVKDRNVPVKNILAFTFTNKAANELKERIGSQLNADDISTATIGTFHSICVKLMHIYGKLVGIDTFTIADPSDARKAIKNIVDDLMISMDKKGVDGIQSAISEFKNSLMTPDQAIIRATNSREREIALVYQRYQAYLESHNIMDFDDIIGRMIHLLDSNQQLKDIINNKFKYIMVDEVQDTNEAQHKLIKLLAGTNNVFMVGQSAPYIRNDI